METNVTFTGREAEPISAKELDTIIKMLDAGEPQIHQVSHNCDNSRLLDMFGVVDVGNAKDSYFGLPVYKKDLGAPWRDLASR